MSRSASVAAVVSAAVLGPVCVAMPAHAAVTIVEAESGTIDNPWCGDDPPMRAVADGTASGGYRIFYPGDGCSQTFHAPARQRVVAFRLLVGGWLGQICGRLEVSGAMTGASDEFCMDDSSWTVVPANTTTGVGDYQVTWHPTGSSPAWLNVDIDYLKVEDVPEPQPEPCSPLAGVVACLEPGSEEIVHTVRSVAYTGGPEHGVVGYLDLYVFDLPLGTRIALPCVTLVRDGVPVDPCRAAGGTYESRMQVLVDQTVAEPAVGEGEELTTVRVCAAKLTLTVGGVGVRSAPAYALC